MATNQTEKPESRLTAALLRGAAFVAVLAVVEVAARLVVKDVGGPESHGLIYRPAIAANSVADPRPAFITNPQGLLTARPGAPGINTDGFRAPNWAELEGQPRPVLLLGDDIVYGLGADPITAAFADQLNSAERPVVNLGIPGAGVRQYAALAEQYIPLLKPTGVYLFFNTADDFDLDPPVKPGYPRYHVAGGMPIAAADAEGTPLNLAQAILRANTVAEPPSALDVLLRQTAIGTAVLARIAPRPKAPVNAVLEALRRVQAAAQLNNAQFEIILTPYPKGPRGNAVRHARRLLEEFHPLRVDDVEAGDYADPARGWLNNAGHAKLAAFMRQQLQRAEVLRASAGKGDTPPTLDEFCTALDFNGDKRQRAIDFLNGLKDAVADVAYAPAQDAASPGEFALGYAVLHAQDPAGFPKAFQEYMQGHIHAASGKPYTEIAAGAVSRKCDDFEAELPDNAKANFQMLRLRNLAEVETGYDAVGARMRRALEEVQQKRRADRLPWAAVVQALRLDAAQAPKVLETVLGLKQALADLYSKPPKDGGPAPIQALGTLLREKAAQEKLDAAMTAAGTQVEAASGKTYAELFTAIEAESMKAFQGLLAPEQFGAFMYLGLASLLRVETEKDPFNEALGHAALGDASPGPAPNDPRRFENFFAVLQLDDAQSAKVKEAVNALKDETVEILRRAPIPGGKSPLDVMRENLPQGPAAAAQKMLTRANEIKDPASGTPLNKLLEAAEIRTRQACFKLLRPDQQSRFEKLPPGSFSSVLTGHEPFDDALAGR